MLISISVKYIKYKIRKNLLSLSRNLKKANFPFFIFR